MTKLVFDHAQRPSGDGQTPFMKKLSDLYAPYREVVNEITNRHLHFQLDEKSLGKVYQDVNLKILTILTDANNWVEDDPSSNRQSEVYDILKPLANRFDQMKMLSEDQNNRIKLLHTLFPYGLGHEKALQNFNLKMLVILADANNWVGEDYLFNRQKEVYKTLTLLATRFEQMKMLSEDQNFRIEHSIIPCVPSLYSNNANYSIVNS